MLSIVRRAGDASIADLPIRAVEQVSPRSSPRPHPPALLSVPIYGAIYARAAGTKRSDSEEVPS